MREPDDGYWDNVWMKKPWCMSYWNGRPTADWMFATAYAEGAAWNETYWKHPKFNELLIAGAASETDHKKRAAMYAEMQQIQADDGGDVVIMFNNYVERPQRQPRARRHCRELGHRRDEDRIPLVVRVS